ncbi:catechol 1,2-dioxygenase, partial [Pseudomonas sp. JG-B]|nr:catechol 1,2-dioxygenase [Pseudomonas sp. JG-B]
MSNKLSSTESVQKFFQEVSGFNNDRGSPRMKQLVNRILVDSI